MSPTGWPRGSGSTIAGSPTSPPVEELDTLALRCLIARMAADGSWGQESTRPAPMSPQARARLTREILALLD
ncbi:hypothetical protein [Arachnia propionica]|uniref:hypothetical protein n=1 Tax=Arachnia propionica TaxID=1750 RepID=UPI00163AD8F4|nr:hypothetical protein [Arachnia propionica]